MKKPQLAFLLLMSLCASPVTAAQQETATITGSVKDQSGAIVPKAIGLNPSRTIAALAEHIATGIVTRV